MTKLWHISDTHSFHNLLEIPLGIDIVIFSGDESNPFEVYKNEPECKDFITWFGNLPIKNKIMVAGNHSAFISKFTKEFKELCRHFNIIYLENESVEIEGLKIWGSPISPTFGDWYFMKSRDKMQKLWENIPDDTDILITHTPQEVF